jgi:hypothetical protein
MHLFASEAREEIIRRMQEEAANHTGLTLRRKQVSLFRCFRSLSLSRAFEKGGKCARSNRPKF